MLVLVASINTNEEGGGGGRRKKGGGEGQFFTLSPVARGEWSHLRGTHVWQWWQVDITFVHSPVKSNHGTEWVSEWEKQPTHAERATQEQVQLELQVFSSQVTVTTTQYPIPNTQYSIVNSQYSIHPFPFPFPFTLPFPFPPFSFSLLGFLVRSLTHTRYTPYDNARGEGGKEWQRRKSIIQSNSML